MNLRRYGIFSMLSLSIYAHGMSLYLDLQFLELALCSFQHTTLVPVIKFIYKYFFSKSNHKWYGYCLKFHAVIASL